MTKERWLAMLAEEHIDLRDPHNFWIMMCARVGRNIREQKECVGFDVVKDSKGQFRILDSTTQTPMTSWHTNYIDALNDLNSSRVPRPL